MPSLVVVVVVVVVMPGQARQQNLANHSKEGNRLPKEGKDTTRPGIGFGKKIQKQMISPRIELGTFCVLSRCHNRLDHETNLLKYGVIVGDMTSSMYHMPYSSSFRGSMVNPNYFES